MSRRTCCVARHARGCAPRNRQMTRVPMCRGVEGGASVGTFRLRRPNTTAPGTFARPRGTGACSRGREQSRPVRGLELTLQVVIAVVVSQGQPAATARACGPDLVANVKGRVRGLVDNHGCAVDERFGGHGIFVFQIQLRDLEVDVEFVRCGNDTESAAEWHAATPGWRELRTATTL